MSLEDLNKKDGTFCDEILLNNILIFHWLTVSLKQELDFTPPESYQFLDKNIARNVAALTKIPATTQEEFIAQLPLLAIDNFEYISYYADLIANKPETFH